MTWVLFVIYLSTGSGLKAEDVKVEHGEVIKSFITERECSNEIKRIFKDAKEQGNPVPLHVNMGCVPFKDGPNSNHFDNPREDERSM